MAADNYSGFLVRHRWLVLAVVAVLAVIVLASFMSRDDATPIRAAAVSRGTIRSVVSTNGKVEPLNNFEAHAPIGTTVKKLLVKAGDHVKKGQLLLQLNDAEARSQAARASAQISAAQARSSAIQSGGNREEVLTVESQLVKAQADYNAAQRNLEALRRLQQKGSASLAEVKESENQVARTNADLQLLQQKQKGRYSQPEMAQVQSQLTEAQSAYAAAENVLSELNIRAPFDGIVYSLPVQQGAYVNPGDMLLQEADLSKVLVRAFVDEPDLGRLAPGEKIEVTWDALPGRVWDGTVSSIPAIVKLRGTRNVGETTCVVDNHDLKLLPNINVGVTIVTQEHANVLTVPREAIRQDDSGRTFVYAIVNNELQRRDVQVSISNLTKVEVTSGISEQTLVALNSTNSKQLRKGAAVRVVR
jgi:HlyD family secretion protein